jgi:NAD(P)-dependent dehydrogenase (short-subunit alcohol dehydrogenase family)
MDLQLSDKTALITGATSGIGFAAAAEFAREGASVIINGHQAAQTEQAVARLLDAVPGATARGITADVGTAEGIQRLIDAACDADILVNNVGIYAPQPFESITDADWLRFFEVNVMSGVRLARHHLGRMLARNWGRIIFVSSESAVQVAPDMLHYSMTKAAQLSVSRGLAELTAGTAVTVNAVLPGPTWTEGMGSYVGGMAREKGLTNAEMQKMVFSVGRPTSLLQRFATPDEVANMITYLASPLASATNGAAVRVEGGVLRSIF